MKNNIKNIVIILLVVFAAFLIYVNINQKKQLTNNATGTYSMNNREIPYTEDQKYLALNSDGEYYYYEQFKMISKGEYIEEDGNETQRIYSLRENKKLFGQFVLYGDKCYFYKEKDQIVLLSKITDECTLINVQDK